MNENHFKKTLLSFLEMSRQWAEPGYSMVSGQNVSSNFKNGDNSGMLFRKAQINQERVNSNPAATQQQKQAAQNFSQTTTHNVIRSAAERRALEKGKW